MEGLQAGAAHPIDFRRQRTKREDTNDCGHRQQTHLRPHMWRCNSHQGQTDGHRHADCAKTHKTEQPNHKMGGHQTNAHFNQKQRWQVYCVIECPEPHNEVVEFGHLKGCV